MAPGLSKDFIAGIHKYYEDNKIYDEKFKEAMKQKRPEYDKPKRTYADIQREQCAEAIKPLDDFDWNFGVNIQDPKDLAEALGKLDLKPKPPAKKPSLSGKKGSKK